MSDNCPTCSKPLEEETYTPYCSAECVKNSPNPTPLDPLMVQIGDILLLDLERRGWAFSIQGKPLDYDEVALPTGLLSVLMFHVAETYEAGLQQKLPLYYYTNPQSLVEVSPAFLPTQRTSFVLLAHFAHYALDDLGEQNIELLKNREAIPVDALYEKWYQAAQENKLVFKDALQKIEPLQPMESKGKSGSGMKTEQGR